MGGEGSATKRRVAVGAVVAAFVLAGASFAWACVSGNESLSVSPNSGVSNPAGQPTSNGSGGGGMITVEGRDWLPGRVNIYLKNVETSATHLLATAPVDSADVGTFKVQAPIPSALAPGQYLVTVGLVQGTKETISRSAVEGFRVVPPQTQTQQPPANTGGQAPTPVPNQGTSPVGNEQAAPAPVPVDVPVAATNADAAPVAAPAPEPVVGQAPVAPEVTVDAQADSLPVSPDAWSGNGSNANPSTGDRGLLDDTGSADSNTGLMVGAGFLAAGSMALFGGFTVAVARRRRVRVHAGPQF